jgi:hypothetical protein
MSPREKHIPDDAQRTTVALTGEDRAATLWISQLRKASNNRRTTTNDILVDALWAFMEKLEGPSREQIRSTLPKVHSPSQRESNLTEMPKSRAKRDKISV